MPVSPCALHNSRDTRSVAAAMGGSSLSAKKTGPNGGVDGCPPALGPIDPSSRYILLSLRGIRFVCRSAAAAASGQHRRVHPRPAARPRPHQRDDLRLCPHRRRRFHGRRATVGNATIENAGAATFRSDARTHVTPPWRSHRAGRSRTSLPRHRQTLCSPLAPCPAGSR